MPDPAEGRSLPDQGEPRTYFCPWVVQDAGPGIGVRVVLGTAADRLQAENARLLGKWSETDALWIAAKAEVARLRECLAAAGAKFHELDLPVYADACLREAAGDASPIGSLHADKAEIRRLRAENERLRQGLWDCAAAAGMDTDGDTGPQHLAHPDIVDLALREVRHLASYEDDEVAELRAGISWARGLCTDEKPHAQIDHFLGCVLAGKAQLPGASDEQEAHRG